MEINPTLGHGFKVRERRVRKKTLAPVRACPFPGLPPPLRPLTPPAHPLSPRLSQVMSVSEWAARWKRNDDFPDCLHCGGDNTKEHHFMQASEGGVRAGRGERGEREREKKTSTSPPRSPTCARSRFLSLFLSRPFFLDLVPGQEDMGGRVPVHGLPGLQLVSGGSGEEVATGLTHPPLSSLSHLFSPLLFSLPCQASLRRPGLQDARTV